MKTMKVYECQMMPEKLRDIYFAFWDDQCNNSYVQWQVGDTTPNDPPDEGDIQRGMIDKWLMDNGAVDLETVLISYWW